MKDRALQAALRFDDPGRRLNALREYLQGFILRSLHESEASRSVVFVGGTALRFLEDLPRFSEDLDFSRIATDGYDPVRWLGKLKRDLHLAGFDSAVRWIDREPVQVAWIRTASLLVAPNLPFLQRALDQTQGAGRHRAADWPRLLRTRLAAVQTGELIRDVEPFLERPADAALLERVNLDAMLAASAESRGR